MPRLTPLILALLIGPMPAAQEQLREVVAVSRRPMRDIGVVATTLDSAMLRENIAHSMADVIAYGSAIYVKNYGRATLSTVSFRGTAPGHTLVTWNGLNVNSPMLGTTDFSTIPAFMVDRASVIHGSASLDTGSGGLGGAVVMSTDNLHRPDGFSMSYRQGVGSFTTLDEHLQLAYRRGGWTSATRVAVATSPNDFTYINRDKILNIYDDDHNIIGRYHPRERNRNASYRDVHVLHEMSCESTRAGRFTLSGWLSSIKRELPMLSTDYSNGERYENVQRDNTVRAVAQWQGAAAKWQMAARVSYVHAYTAYDYRRDPGSGIMNDMTVTRSTVNSAQTHAEGRRFVGRVNLKACIDIGYNHVNTVDRTAHTGYRKGRPDGALSATARWEPTTRAGLSAIIREELSGHTLSAPIPALMADYRPLQGERLVIKASASRNYRFPTLNDLYFVPGGNPDLKHEYGWSYDLSAGTHARAQAVEYSLECGWFDSYINQWILWLPTPKGFFAPRNIRRVHAYGIETTGALSWQPARQWLLDFRASYSWTPSIHQGDPVSEVDRSPGAQLPYTPRHSASATLTAKYARWELTYKWLYYSSRTTMTSVDPTPGSTLEPYFMSNVAVGTYFSSGPSRWDFKFTVNNIFNMRYVTVLSRPMPGINFQLQVGYSFR